MSRRSDRFRWCSAEGLLRALHALSQISTRNRGLPIRISARPADKKSRYVISFRPCFDWAASEASVAHSLPLAEEAHADGHVDCRTPRRAARARRSARRVAWARADAAASSGIRGDRGERAAHRRLRIDGHARTAARPDAAHHGVSRARVSARARLRPPDRVEECVRGLLRDRRAASQPVSDVRRLWRDRRDSRRRPRRSCDARGTLRQRRVADRRDDRDARARRSCSRDRNHDAARA